MKKKLIIGLSGLAGSGKDFIANLLVEEHGFVKIALADPLKRICQEVFDFSDEQLWGPSEERNKPDKRYFTGKFKSPTKEEIIRFEDDRVFSMLSGESGDFSENELYRVYLTPRFALQTLGTEWGRNCYPNIWTDYTLRVAKMILSDLDGPYDVYWRYGPKTGLWKDPDDETPEPKGVVISDIRFRNEMEAVKKEGGKVIRIRRDKPTTLSGSASLHSSEQEQHEIADEEFDYILHNHEDLPVLKEELSSMIKKLAE